MQMSALCSTHLFFHRKYLNILMFFDEKYDTLQDV